MADKKTTELQTVSVPAGEDLLLIIDDPSGTPVTKKISLSGLVGNIPSNTVINASLTVSNGTVLNGNSSFGNTVFTGTSNNFETGNLQLENGSTITSNNATTQFGSAGKAGTITWDSDYLYVATSDTEIKRVALSTWNV